MFICLKKILPNTEIGPSTAHEYSAVHRCSVYTSTVHYKAAVQHTGTTQNASRTGLEDGGRQRIKNSRFSNTLF